MQTSRNQLYEPAKAKAYFEDKLAFTIGPVEVEHLIKSHDNSFTIVDVREADDYAKGHVPGAINLPRGSWSNPAGLSKDKTNIVYCYTQTCHLAAMACLELSSLGFPVKEMEGGFAAWKDSDLDIEREAVNRLKRAGGRLFHRNH